MRNLTYKMAREVFCICFLLTLLACTPNASTNNDVSDHPTSGVSGDLGNDVVGEKVDTSTDKTSKIQPPVRVEYKIIGIPEVGQPLDVELSVHNTLEDTPINVSFAAADRDALQFIPTANGSQAFKLSGNFDKRKLVVVPQRQGRSAFQVLTSFDTPDGVMTTSTTIIVNVGNVPVEKQINGTLTTDENGEAIISMPAKSQ